MKITQDHVFFWGGIFSNWSNVAGGITAVIGGNTVSFPTSEHIFMYYKAVCFKDLSIASELLKTSDPKEAKRLGRKIKGFSEDIWQSYREDAMFTAVKMRAAFDSAYRQELISPLYQGKTFVEASPYDKIWGIGMSEDDPDVDDESKWRGLNLLGKTLGRLRDGILDGTV